MAVRLHALTILAYGAMAWWLPRWLDETPPRGERRPSTAAIIGGAVAFEIVEALAIAKGHPLVITGEAGALRAGLRYQFR